MKKYLPIILFLTGALILVGVYFLVIKKPLKVSEEEPSSQIEVSLEDRPVVSLTPSADGHYLMLSIGKFKIDAASLDYELLYDLPDGRTQGVPGTVSLEGKSAIEKDLLMGSESSGKFRYDEGVEEGDLTIRFRNDKGKLLIKFATKFHLQSGTKNLTSIDGKFGYNLDKATPNTYFVTMETFGVSNPVPAEVTAGPYGVFSSAKSNMPGTVELDGTAAYRASAGSWESLTGGKATDIGIFIGAK